VQSLEDIVLKATLKENFNKSTGKEESSDGRQQYRVIHSELMFVLQYSGSQKGKGNAERGLNDFRKLVDALKKLYPGCFVPMLPKQTNSADLPMSIFEFRKTPMEDH
jgi:hypothetical protein